MIEKKLEIRPKIEGHYPNLDKVVGMNNLIEAVVSKEWFVEVRKIIEPYFYPSSKWVYNKAIPLTKDPQWRQVKTELIQFFNEIIKQNILVDAHNTQENKQDRIHINGRSNIGLIVIHHTKTPDFVLNLLKKKLLTL